MLRSRGFTLIEILVVLFIISIVSTVALLSISRNTNKHIETFANELTQQMTLAEEQALLQPAVFGLLITDHSFQFFVYQSPTEKNKQASWVPLQDTVFSKGEIPSDMQVKVVMANADAADTNAAGETDGMHANTGTDAEKSLPQIIISPNGDLTPFTIYIGKRDDKPRYAITGDADGTVTNKALY